MNAQQLHDYIVKPTLEYMGGNYNTVEARFLLLCTAAIESECGHYIKQIGGPALGIWQMEPATHDDICHNCDAMNNVNFENSIERFTDDIIWCSDCNNYNSLMVSPMYACAMARLKYSMDSKALPAYNGGTDLDIDMFYRYYKRVYNTGLGASTFDKWLSAIERNGILKVKI